MTDKMFHLSTHIRNLPKAEEDHARIVDLQFGDLTSYLERFRDGLELFSALGRMADAKSSWRHITCREGAMVLWHYTKALEAIKSNLAKAPTLQKAVSIRVVQEAIKEFRACFPDVIGVRHSVGHTA